MTLLDAPRTARGTTTVRDLAAVLDAAPEIVERAETASADPGPTFDELRSHLQAWLREWDTQRLPAFEQARSIAPAGDRPVSLRSAPTRTDGAVRITASLYDPPNRSGDALAWTRNWVSAVVLPQAPTDGRVYYRFRVGARLVLDGQADTALVSTEVRVGVVPDATAGSPFDAPGFADPIRPLVGVSAREDVDARAEQTVEGSVAVRAGESPVIGIVVGADVVFRDGWMRLHEGSSLWVGSADGGPTGSIEVRFASDALLDLLGGSA
ncbi:hypothetical protein [Agromyces marinus]|uniref:Uncharacterized protein n=1 Tax=Agromyces marinus TaxID=1389020 RepID=A0ABM8GZC0_9MICO|nr:hypothetical protein [Agromyces marinus]UIP57968.1 hypothetical protein DSM26151_08370 [Agromyces marinus]BDZ53829.1 hypothetical protein GCM10025870_09020 [Agromyces marinus]